MRFDNLFKVHFKALNCRQEVGNSSCKFGSEANVQFQYIGVQYVESHAEPLYVTATTPRI
jgi:hypothetical protein